MHKKINNLVVDTTAFIKCANLQDIAENIYTVQEVVDEITNDRQRRKLVVLPYDLNIKNVFPEHIKIITDFSIKTGDYRSLSATDIKVLALTYQLEKEKNGTMHLKTEPTTQKIVNVSGVGDSVNSSSKTEASHSPNKAVRETMAANTVEDSNVAKNIEDEHLVSENVDNNLPEELLNNINNLDLKDDDLDNVMAKISDHEEESDDQESDSSDGEWITPGNIKEKKKEMEHGDFFEDKYVDIACITSDFAMQNVLKQIGLNVTSVDGRIIRQLRTFIFRCTTCFKTTSVMTKLFCPKCGHSTLKKVAVSIDEEGNQHIHINGRKPLTARGKKFSLPTPKGGQHFQYPILTEDQHIQKRFATHLARKKNNPLDPEYTAGFSPFVMRDVNSKSAVLGVRANKQDIKYWMKHHSNGKKK